MRMHLCVSRETFGGLGRFIGKLCVMRGYDRVGIDRARNCIPRNKRLFLNGWMNQILSFASEGMRTAAPAVRKPRCLRRPVYQERTSSLDMRFPPKRRKDLSESPRKKRLLCRGYTIPCVKHSIFNPMFHVKHKKKNPQQIQICYSIRRLLN